MTRFIKNTLNAVALGYFYFVHSSMLKLVGPRLAALITKAIARVHFMLTYLGVGNRTLRILQQLLPEIKPQLSARTALKRHILMKHQNYSEWNSFLTARGHKYVANSGWEIEGKERLSERIDDGKGAIILVYHYGVAKMIVPYLSTHGFDIAVHRNVAETYTNKTFGWMSDAVRLQAIRNETESGLRIFFHNPDCSLPILVRHLLRGGILSVNGDGMTGNDFAVVPFLGSSMSFPLGPAQIAAHAQVPIFPVFLREDELGQRKLKIGEPITARDTSHESLEEVTIQCVAQLEAAIVETPDAWWTWRRLRFVESTDGTSSLAAELHTGAIPSTTNQPVAVVEATSTDDASLTTSL